MDIKKIVKQYEDAMENYENEMLAYNKAMPKFNKESMEYRDTVSRLINVTMCGDIDGGYFEADFYATAKESEKLKKKFEKIKVEVEVPREPVEPCKPTLEVRTERSWEEVPF